MRLGTNSEGEPPQLLPLRSTPTAPLRIIPAVWLLTREAPSIGTQKLYKNRYS